MKSPSSRWAFSLGFVVGSCSLYFFLRQVWFERSYPVLSEAQENAAAVKERPATESSSWRKEGAALINLLHPQHTGAFIVHSPKRLHVERQMIKPVSMCGTMSVRHSYVCWCKLLVRSKHNLNIP